MVVFVQNQIVPNWEAFWYRDLGIRDEKSSVRGSRVTMCLMS